MILKKVIDMLAEYSDISPDEIKKDTPLEELALDTYDMVELVMTIEDEFGVYVEFNNAIKTVGNVAEYIEDNM